jgi:DNA-directed RNA polymerase subunit RPC12/RpoP
MSFKVVGGYACSRCGSVFDTKDHAEEHENDDSQHDEG